jgi:hypothetical protein
MIEEEESNGEVEESWCGIVVCNIGELIYVIGTGTGGRTL